LHPLLASSPGIHTLVALDATPPDFDVEAPLLSLPGLLGTTLDTVPARVPYLAPPAGLVEGWRGELSAVPGFRVGIAWHGDPKHGNRQRTASLAAFEPLARVPGVRLLSLQKGPGSEQLAQLGGRFAVTDLGASLDGASGAFADTAAVMRCLDLVVCI